MTAPQGSLQAGIIGMVQPTIYWLCYTNNALEVSTSLGKTPRETTFGLQADVVDRGVLVCGHILFIKSLSHHHQKTMKLSDAILQFNHWRAFKVGDLTVKGYHGTLRQFCIFMRDAEMESITVHDVLEWYRLMEKTGYEQNTFMRNGIAMRKFFEFFTKQGFPVLDPWLIPVPKSEFKFPRVTSEETYQKVLAVIPNNNDPRNIRNKAIATLLWETGARVGELMSLNVADLREKRATIKTEKSRGKRPVREIYWTDHADVPLKRWLETRERMKKTMTFEEPDALFVSLSMNMGGRRFTNKGVGCVLRKYSNKANVPYANAHGSRHHFAREVIKNGGSGPDVMNLLGHASLDSSTPYTMMQNSELEERYRKFKGFSSPVKSPSSEPQNALSDIEVPKSYPHPL